MGSLTKIFWVPYGYAAKFQAHLSIGIEDLQSTDSQVSFKLTLVLGSLTKISRQSMKLVPLKGSPPMPTHRVCPRPTCKINSVNANSMSKNTFFLHLQPVRPSVFCSALMHLSHLLQCCGSSRYNFKRFFLNWLKFLMYLLEKNPTERAYALYQCNTTFRVIHIREDILLPRFRSIKSYIINRRVLFQLSKI